MKKIKFLKLMRGYDEAQGGFIMGEGKYSYGCHFEQAEGYIHECGNGVKVAISRAYSYGEWRATEITTGYSVGRSFDKIKDTIKDAEYAATAIAKVLAEKRTRTVIEQLNKYKKQLKITA